MIKKTAHMRGRDIWPLVEKREILLGGYRPNKIYGRLDCKSANRHLSNGTYQNARVLFESESEAILEGYRPCGNCLPLRYKVWKQCNAAKSDYTIELTHDIEGEAAEWQIKAEDQ